MTGNGTESNPYVIYDVDDLQIMDTKSSTAYFVLNNDIDASVTSGWNGGLGFLPMYTWADRFRGSLDGQNHSIVGLYMSRSDGGWGWINYTDGGATIENLGIIDCTNISDNGNIIGHSLLVGYASGDNGWSYFDNVWITNGYLYGHDPSGGVAYDHGGICGYTKYVSFKDCVVNGIEIYSGSTNFGGPTGGMAGGKHTCRAENCHVKNVSITILATSGAWNTRTGGMFGEFSGYADKCSVIGGSIIINNPASNKRNVGGFCGEASYGIISNSFARITLNGYSRVGGFCGESGGNMLFHNCYSTGAVNGTTDLGGFIGYGVDQNWCMECYWDTETSGRSTSEGGVGLTTSEMKLQSSYIQLVSRQLIMGNNFWLKYNDDRYSALVGGDASIDRWYSNQVVATDGSFVGYIIKPVPGQTLDDPDEGYGCDVVFQKNGADVDNIFLYPYGYWTDLYGDSCWYSLDVSPGDDVNFHQKVFDYGVETVEYSTGVMFEPNNQNESLVMGHAVIDGAGTTYTPIMGVVSEGFSDEVDARIVWSISGKLKNLYIKQMLSPEAPNYITYTVRKNSADTNLSCTISDAEYSGNNTLDEVDVGIGDVLDIKIYSTTTTTNLNVAFGLCFEANVAGEFVFGGGSNVTLSGTTAYNSLFTNDAMSWSSSEGEKCGASWSNFEVRDLAIKLNGSPSPGSYTFTLRDDGGNTALSTSVTSSYKFVSNTVKFEESIDTENFLNLKVSPFNSPTTRKACWGVTGYKRNYWDFSTVWTIRSSNDGYPDFGGDANVTGLYVRGDTIQVVYDAGGFSVSPDFGASWYAGTGITEECIDVVFDVNNDAYSVVIGKDHLYYVNSVSGYYYDFSQGYAYSGIGVVAEADSVMPFALCGVYDEGSDESEIIKILNWGKDNPIENVKTFYGEIAGIAIGGTLAVSGVFCLDVDVIGDGYVAIDDVDYIQFPVSGYYQRYSIVDLEAIAYSDSCFNNWIGNVVDIDSASTTISMYTNESVVAKFYDNIPILLTSDGWTIFSYHCDIGSFYVYGMYWQFYVYTTDDPVYYLYYKTSSDGISWSSAIQATFTGSNHRGIAMYYDEGNNVIHITWADGSYYRAANPQSNGTLSWLKDAQDTEIPWQVQKVGIMSYYGHAYIVGNVEYGAYDQKIWKNDNTDGTWSTTDGYPLTIYNGTSSNYVIYSHTVPITGGVAIIYSRILTGVYTGIKAKLLIGDSLGSEENASSSALGSGHVWCARSIGSIVHVLFVDDSDNLIHISRNVTWSSETELASNVEEAVLIVDQNDMVALYTKDIDGDDAIYRRRYISGTWEAEELIYNTETQIARFCSNFSSSVSHKVIVAWTKGTMASNASVYVWHMVI